MLGGAREQQVSILGEGQTVVAAARQRVEHGDGLAVPFRQRVGHPAHEVQVAVNVQRTFGTQNVAHDGGFSGARRRDSQLGTDGKADQFNCLHLEPSPNQMSRQVYAQLILWGTGPWAVQTHDIPCSIATSVTYG